MALVVLCKACSICVRHFPWSDYSCGNHFLVSVCYGFIRRIHCAGFCYVVKSRCSSFSLVRLLVRFGLCRCLVCCNTSCRLFCGGGGVVLRLRLNCALHGFLGGLCGSLLNVRRWLCLRGLGRSFCNAVYILISGGSVCGSGRFYFISGYALGGFPLYIHGRLLLHALRGVFSRL